MHLLPTMWAYENHFHIQYVDDGNMTQDCGVEIKFNQSSHSIHRDENLIYGKLGYLGNIQEIMQVDLSSFQCVIFKCKWWDTIDQNNVNLDHDSGIICINSQKMLVEEEDPYVFPKPCN